MLPVTTEEKHEVVLQEHEGMENPPTFVFPCLNGRQQRELVLFKESMDKSSLENRGGLENFDALFEKIESCLLGWENLSTEYSKGKLMDVVGYAQCLELLACLTYQSPSIAAKKKSKSPSPSGTEKSAPPAKDKESASEPSTETADGE